MPHPLNSIFHGVHLIEDTLTAIDVWQLLHSDAQEWETTPRNSKFFKIREMLDQADRDALKKLRKFSAANWEHLCFGAGWTVYGAVGLSWCEGAEFAKVADCWQHSGFDLNVYDISLRAAKMINADIVSSSQKLSEVIEELENNTFRISLALAAREGRIEIDLPAQSLEPSPEHLVPFLIMAIEHSPRKAEFSELLEKWQQIK